MVKALLIQRAKGEMELVPSAVGPYEMEQQYRNVKVRTLEGWSPEAGNAPLGAVIDKMGGRFHPVKPGSPLVRQPRRRKKR